MVRYPAVGETSCQCQSARLFDTEPDTDAAGWCKPRVLVCKREKVAFKVGWTLTTPHEAHDLDRFFQCSRRFCGTAFVTICRCNCLRKCTCAECHFNTSVGQ